METVDDVGEAKDADLNGKWNLNMLLLGIVILAFGNSRKAEIERWVLDMPLHHAESEISRSVSCYLSGECIDSHFF